MSCARGRKFARALPHFAEKILFMIPGVTKGASGVEPRWEDGVFLGVSDLHMGTGRDMHKVRTFRRREATERSLLPERCVRKTLGWPKGAKGVRVVLLDVSPPAAMAEAEAIRMTRRLYINRVDIMKHWLTEGCLGCSPFAEGEGAQGHSEGCRARLEAEIARESA